MRRYTFITSVYIVGLTAAFICGARAENGAVFTYPEGRHKAGTLQRIGGLPVLIVQGTPEQMGEQVGVLGGRPGARVTRYPRDLLLQVGADWSWSTFVAAGRGMLARFPAHHRVELDAIIRHSGVDPDLCIAGNTIFDMKKLFACSSVLVDSERGQDGRILFGRNFDFPSLNYLHEYTLVTVYRPTGKHAFASIGFPCLVGVLSGMNDAGLAIAVHEAYMGADRSAQFDPHGVPFALLVRRILEECTTIEEAAELLRSAPRTTQLNLPIADAKAVAILEVTSKNVVVRPADCGVCFCTNHFLSESLRVREHRNTYETLDRYRALGMRTKAPKLGVADLQIALHAANLGTLTLQTMIFEPKVRVLHLAIGGLPASGQPLRKLDLEPLFDESKNAKPSTTRTK